MTVHEAYHMRPWDEVLGSVHEVKEEDGHCLALIGKIPIILPQEMTARLTEAKGQRVGVLRTDSDYRFRVITAKPNRDACSNNIAQEAL